MLTGSNKFERGHSHESFGDEDRTVPAAITDTGCERDLNEDRYAVIECASGLAWFVCDGMGGTAGGELAAQLAIDGIRRDLEGLPARSPVSALKSAILESNRIIVLRRQNQAFAQMGTTVVGVLFSGIEMALGHVGDSRAYVVRAGQIEQLTTDHTYVQELVEKGEIQPEEALAHPQAHILTRCVGAEPGVEITIQKYWIWQVAEEEPTDLLVLCTDGLYSHVSDDELAQIVSDHAPQRACVRLVEIAKARGGFDNITVAVVPIGGQLRQEPPQGYDEVQAMRARREASGRPPMKRRSWIMTFALVLALSIVAALLVIVTMAFYMSR